MQLEPGVASLVKTLNKIEGVFPASSCGGHKCPKKYQMGENEFNVIMKITNQNFLNGLQKLYAKHKNKSLFEKHSLYGTWCLAGTTYSKNHIYEPWVNKYLNSTNELKPRDRWDLYYSYCNTHPTRLKE